MSVKDAVSQQYDAMMREGHIGEINAELRRRGLDRVAWEA